MSEELPLETATRWHVVPVFKSQTKEERKSKAPPVIKHHELRFGSECHEKATGEAGVERLREIAKIMNRHNASPRRAIECLADIGGNLDAAMARQTKLAELYTAELTAKRHQ